MIPGSVTSIHSMIFAGCGELTEIYFLGNAPAIDEDAFYGVWADTYYPAGNSTWTQSKRDYYGGYPFWTPYAKGETPWGAPNAPTVKAANETSTGKIKLSWNKVDGAVGYKVYRSTSKNGTYTLLKNTTGTSLTHAPAAGSTYYYYVTSVVANGTASKPGNIVSCTAKAAQPKVTLSNVASSGKVKISWSAVTGAAKYKVYYSTAKDGTYTALKTTTGTSVTHSSAAAGKTYYYKVIALAENSAANSAFSAIKSLTCKLPQPKVTLGNIQSTGKIKVMWDAVEGAAKYKVYYSTSKEGTYTGLTTTTGTSVTHASTEAGQTYYYKVIALADKSAANSAYSAVVQRVCDLARPVAKVQLNSDGKPVVSWKSISGAVKYTVYFYDANGELFKSTNTSATTLTHSGAVAGETYSYRVAALADPTAANSAKSVAVSITSN